jgi:hypothetical protein
MMAVGPIGQWIRDHGGTELNSILGDVLGPALGVTQGISPPTPAEQVTGTSTPGASAQAVAGAVGGALSDAGKALSLTATIWASITDYRMWRSLGWLLLGILLFLIGFVVWNKKTIANVGKVAAVL